MKNIEKLNRMLYIWNKKYLDRYSDSACEIWLNEKISHGNIPINSKIIIESIKEIGFEKLMTYLKDTKNHSNNNKMVYDLCKDFKKLEDFSDFEDSEGLVLGVIEDFLLNMKKNESWKLLNKSLIEFASNIGEINIFECLSVERSLREDGEAYELLMEIYNLALELNQTSLKSKPIKYRFNLIPLPHCEIKGYSRSGFTFQLEIEIGQNIDGVRIGEKTTFSILYEPGGFKNASYYEKIPIEI